jgi:hypothetical protein
MFESSYVNVVLHIIAEISKLLDTDGHSFKNLA